jgi:FLVCR family MFS transporter
MGVESAYPVAEGLTTCVLTSVNNLGCLVFLLIPMIPGIGTAWMNWSVAAACVASLVCVVPFSSNYGRYKEDAEYDSKQALLTEVEPATL